MSAGSLGKRFREIDAKNDWITLYNKIRQDSSKLQSKCVVKTAKSNENVKLNRYRDVLPFDHSRVVLPSGSYINASHVSVNKADRDYVLTQGPLPDTSEHFWEMVWHQKSKAVIMLNKIIEKNQIKCHQYYPVRAQAENGVTNPSLNFGDYEVKLLNENETRHYCLRNLLLKQKKLQEEREILHYQFSTWPDFGVPESTHDFLEFLYEVRKTNVLNHRIYGPPIIHCSAGIGRSGTFIIVDSALVIAKKTKNPSDIDILKMVIELRQYRMGLIQTYEQLRFSWKAVVDALENEEWKSLIDTPCCESEPQMQPILTKKDSGSETGTARPDYRRSSANNMTDSDPEDDHVRSGSSLKDALRVNSIPNDANTPTPTTPTVVGVNSDVVGVNRDVTGVSPDEDADMMSPKRRKSNLDSSSDQHQQQQQRTGQNLSNRSSGQDLNSGGGGVQEQKTVTDADFTYPAGKEEEILRNYEHRLRKRQQKANELREKIERIHMKLHQSDGQRWWWSLLLPYKQHWWLMIGGGAALGVGLCAFLYTRWFYAV